MVTFGLVHGAYHGAWCWEKLSLELEHRGHQVLAVDLPAEDPASCGRSTDLMPRPRRRRHPRRSARIHRLQAARGIRR